MELKIQVCADDSCKVIVKDITEVGDNGYLPESSAVTVKNRFKYSDTVSIDVLQYNKTTGPEVQVPTYTEHSDVVKPIVLPVGFDGWFDVVHIVLPSQEWFVKEQEKEAGSALPIYDTVYFSDGKNVYKYINEEVSAVELSEIIERNEEGTTISRISENYVSICFLKKCYISLCQQIFNNRGFSKCWGKSAQIGELTYRRDLVWMAINVIEYMTEFNQLAEVKRVIEQIGGCNGLCKSEFKQIPNHGCGCSK